jgi:hypothetical protein
MRGRIRALATTLIAAVVALLFVPAPSALADDSVQPPPFHVYDGYHHPAHMTGSSTERGPPSPYDHTTIHDAAHHWSSGASACSDEPTPSVATTYDNPTRLVPGAQVAGTTRVQALGNRGFLLAFAPKDDAAKTVDDLPTVNWGQQSKHFPGHPNLIPGRSTLTANPEALIQRAGTGTPVGSVPRGQAGFKERIDFGDNIGTYVSRDGTSSPTSIGILHYRADGSVHIIPGRPQ